MCSPTEQLVVLLIIEYAHIRQRIERDRNPYGA